MIGDKYVVVSTSFVDRSGNKYTAKYLGTDVNVGDILEVKSTYNDSITELIFKGSKCICEVGSDFEKGCLKKVIEHGCK